MTAKRRRNQLSPKPILDKPLLREALDLKGIRLKDFHYDTFYQLLHRKSYPSLPTFVEQYYKNEDVETVAKILGTHDSFRNKNENIPHKNPISKKKKNIRLLPKAFLNFLAGKTINNQIHKLITINILMNRLFVFVINRPK